MDTHARFSRRLGSWYHLVALTGDDEATNVALPFSVSFYGVNYASVNVATNGSLSFTAASTAFTNTTLPTTALPNGAVYVDWDDYLVDASSSVQTALLGSAPNRSFVIEWRNIIPYQATERWDFEVIIYEAGGMLFQYQGIDAPRDTGTSATVGLENAAGTDAFQFSFNTGVLTNTKAILFSKAGGPF